MPYWREHSSIACPQCQGSGPTAPRSVSEQTDAIMRHLASAPSDLAVRSAPQSGTRGDLAWLGSLLDPGEEAPDWPPPTPKVEPQSYQRVASPAMFLQLGARGLDALRTLGPAAAAALAAIIKSYQDQLGRPPSPSELDQALQDRISEPPREPMAAPNVSPEAEFFKKPSRRDNEAACERQYAMETEQCNKTTKSYGKRAGALCHAAAMDRYAECLSTDLAASALDCQLCRIEWYDISRRRNNFSLTEFSVDALKDCFLVRVDKRSRKLVVHYLVPAGRGSFRPSLFTDFPMSRLKSMSVEQAARYLGHSILIGMKYTRDRLYADTSNSRRVSKRVVAKRKTRGKTRQGDR